MGDENPNPAGSDPGAKGGTTTATPEQQTTTPRTYTDEDVNRLRAKDRKTIEDMQARIAKSDEEKKTEAEKALDAKLKERDEQWETKLKQQDIKSELKLKLAEAGYSPKLAAVVLAESTIESVEDIPGAIASALADIPKNDRVEGQGAGGGKLPPGVEYPKNGRWTRAQVQEVRLAGRYAEFKKSIEEADAKGEIRG